MKRCLYINKENEKKLLEAVAEGVTASSVINDALEIYFNSTVYDMAEFRAKKSYKLMTVRVHEVVINCMEKLKKNCNLKAVIMFVQVCILRKVQEQSNSRRERVPDKYYMTVKDFSNMVEKLKKLVLN